MNPLALRATNYRTFASLELDLPAGCLAVVGENGAGKSSIVNVIDLALFGPEGRSLAEYLTDDGGTELEIELTFEHAGEMHRVRRGFSAKGRGKTTCDFETWSPTSVIGWEPLSRESQKETQVAIEEVLGLSRETFRASAFLAQGDGAAFTEAQPRDRKRILAEVLGLGAWDALLNLARTDKNKADREHTELSGRIALLEETAGSVDELEAARATIASSVLAAEVAHADAEKLLAAAAETVQEIERIAARYVAASSQLSASEARLRERQAVIDRAAAAKLEAVSVQAELSEAGAPTARLAELEERRVAMEAARELRRERETIRDRYVADAEDAHRQVASLKVERDRIEVTLDYLSSKAAALNDPANLHTCDRCGQELRGEAWETAFRRVREERDDAEVRIAAYAGRMEVQAEHASSMQDAAAVVEIPHAPDGNELAALADEILDARNAELALAGLRQKLASLEAQVAEVTPELTAEVVRLATELVTAQEALAAIEEPEPGALDAEKVAAVTRKAELDIASHRLTETRAALVRAEAALEAAQKIALDLGSCRQKQAEIQGELDLLALLERAYGRDGIPALIVESSAIPSIETEASRILAELGTSYRVELRTQKALKSGDGLADTLDVVVIGDAGERSYETFSGGERTRINLALRIALARLLAHRRGAESRLLAIDEPEFLDEAGTALLADVLRGLDQEFDRIMLVSHVPTLRDAFDQTIEVVKEDGRSRIVGDREAVLA